MKSLIQLFMTVIATIAMATPAFAMSKNKPETGRDVASERDIASAEHESKFLSKMMSFDELMQLSPEERTTYLYGIREMLVQLSMKTDKSSQLFVDGRTYDQYQRILDLLIPPADAQWKNTPKQVRSGSKVLPRFVRASPGIRESWACDSADAEFNYDVGTCVAKNGPIRGEAAGCLPGYRTARMTNPTVKAAIFGGPIHKYCVPQASWDMLSIKRRQELETVKGAASVAKVFQPSSSEIGGDITFGNKQRVGTADPALVYPTVSEFRGQNSDPACNSTDKRIVYNKAVGTCTGPAISKAQTCQAGHQKVSIVEVEDPWFGGPTFSEKFYCVTPASWGLLPQERKDVLLRKEGEQRGSNAATESERRAIMKAISERPTEDLPRLAAQYAKERKAKVGAPSPKAPEAQSEPSNETKELTAGGSRCSKVDFIGMTCGSREERDELRKKNRDEWFRENVNTCIFAGNVSEYAGTKKSCKPVSKSAGLNCGSGVICNPLVFGAKEDGQPFCATKNDGEPTLECNELASTGPTNENWMNENIGKLRSDYERLRNGINTMCGRKAAREYYCEECNVILTRLNQLGLFGEMQGGKCITSVPTYENAAERKKTNGAVQ